MPPPPRWARRGPGGPKIQFEQYAEALDRWYHVIAYSPVPDHFAVTFDEITERKKSEQERERLIGELEKRNAELERFTYTASHELKSPLVTIQGFVQAIECELEDGDPQIALQDLARVSRAAERMRGMLEDLLQLARVGQVANRPEPVELGEVLREVLEGLPPTPEGRYELPGELPAVLGDRPRLVEVFHNLFENAVKFAGEGQVPRVRVSAGAAETPGMVTLRVADEGLGLEPEYHERVFKLFEKFHTRIPGTGVGLALVKRIVEVHGGRIWVESEGVGRGATFCLTLPRAGVTEDSE